MVFICHPKCTTCAKARSFLQEKGMAFTERDIREENPTYEELRLWKEKSGLPLHRFFNTSGMLYRSLGLKEQLPSMSEEEQLRLLASDGMLVKRPILVKEDKVLVGFRPAQWETEAN